MIAKPWIHFYQSHHAGSGFRNFFSTGGNISASIVNNSKVPDIGRTAKVQ
jgi:hypothetical protein